jgi:hypothetical protein
MGQLCLLRIRNIGRNSFAQGHSIMKKSSVKTFRTIMIKDNVKAEELAKLVEINGTLYRNSRGEWQAFLPGNAETVGEITAALNQLDEFIKAEIRRDSQYLEEFYNSSDHHALDDFGFTVGKGGKLCIEKTPVQTQADLIEKLQSDLATANCEIRHLQEQLDEVSSWTGFGDVDEDLIPKELDIALMIYRSAINNYDRETGMMNNGEKPKAWIEDCAKADPYLCSQATADRIAMVTNWQKDAGRPKGSKNR